MLLPQYKKRDMWCFFFFFEESEVVNFVREWTNIEERARNRSSGGEKTESGRAAFLIEHTVLWQPKKWVMDLDGDLGVLHANGLCEREDACTLEECARVERACVVYAAAVVRCLVVMTVLLCLCATCTRVMGGAAGAGDRVRVRHGERRVLLADAATSPCAMRGAGRARRDCI